MEKFLVKQNGMTLVELLAAIALLGIVLITFMSIFTQSAKFSAHNQETLTAVQIAEQVVADVRDLDGIPSLNGIGGYKLETGYIVDRDSYDHFDIKIMELEVEIVRPDKPERKMTLKKVIISVKAKPGIGINEPEFTTEMYLKVLP